MWDGIYESDPSSLVFMENNVINDAENLIVSTNCAKYQAIQNELNRNYRNFVASDCPNGLTGDLRNNEIECVTGNTPGNNLIPPHSGERTYSGVEATDVNGYIIGDDSDPIDLNHFYNLDFGIKTIRSSVTVYNNHFENITLPVPATPGLIPRGYAIHANGSGGPGTFQLTVGGTGSNKANFFETCGHGIFANRRMSVEVINNRFNDIRNSNVNAGGFPIPYLWR